MRESLAGLGLAYRFLATVFHAPPTAGFVGGLAAERLMGAWPLPSEDEDTRTGVRLLEGFCAGWTEAMLPDLEGEFNRLFVGPGLPLAPPWESYYLHPDRLLFQEQTLAVRQAYREFGLEAPHGRGEPDDSLSLEFAFASELCDEARLGALRDFMEGHLLRWAPRCLRLVIEGAALDYYRGAAYLGLGCVAEFRRVSGGLA